MKYRSSTFFRFVALYLVFNIVGGICFPTIALALTSGTSSPEFSGFTPVSASEMVNTFTGDFAYNIPIIDVPGPQGSGYSMALAYNSGVTAESEASWVGLGWSLSPGSINRNLRGFPDEYNGERVKYYNKARPNWTATSKTNIGLEIFSSDMQVGFNFGYLHRINNYTGYQKVETYGINFNGCVGVNATKDVNGTTFAPYISPLAILQSLQKKEKADEKDAKTSSTTAVPKSKHDDAINNRNSSRGFTEKSVEKTLNGVGLSLLNNAFMISPVQSSPKPYNYPSTTGFSFNWNFSLGFNPAPYPIGADVGKGGTFSMNYNKSEITPRVYGYNNSLFKPDENVERYISLPLGAGMSDYYMEKDQPFNAADLNLGIPFGNYDVFAVSGEGLSGGFRSFLPTVGHFVPYSENGSKNKFTSGGFEVMLGTNCGAGFDIGFGYQKTTVGANRSYNDASTNNNLKYRFNNDMGGQILYGATADGKVNSNTNIESAMLVGNGHYRSPIQYDREITGTSAKIDKTTQGFSILNKDGIKFLYDQSIKVRNATSLSVDIPLDGFVRNRNIAFRELKLCKSGSNYDITELTKKLFHHKTILGNIDTNSYATSYLLTGIATPSYIDVNNDGLTYDDFGGWTKFDYREAYGTATNNWFRYRMPFTGLNYSQNSISDVKDDLGSVETGEKEVKYLKTIETKTHIAYFVTNMTEDQSGNIYLQGSKTIRKDGYGALELTSSNDPSSLGGNSQSISNGKPLEYLEKIVLYAKVSGSDNIDRNKPLKIVRFEYDYSLVPNTPNNINSNYDDLNNQSSANKPDNGKLTLKKVWVEYEGIVSAKISPYVFNYSYPQNFSKQPALSNYFDVILKTLTDNNQNPSYDPYTLDAWGFNTPKDNVKLSNGIRWTDQSAYVNDLPNDPAAYQLKSIQLPSGGVIYVQYEEKDYAYVQDRNAMAMARITPLNPTLKYNPTINNSEKYRINISDLGVDPTNYEDVEALTAKINKHFQQTSNPSSESASKIYYKFLFSLLDSDPSLDNHQSEYITGYTDFYAATSILVGKNSNDDNVYGVEVQLVGKSPRQACKEFVVNHRQGKLKNNNCIEPMYEELYDASFSAAAANEMNNAENYGSIPLILTQMALGAGLMDILSYTKDENSIGRKINSDLSYLKLPVLHRKVGGGARVKRILLHDMGIENGDEVVLGTEYTYKMEDGITSSGVATNEPGLAREENPLVNFMPKKGETWWNRLIAGENLQQSEGPLGESLLPGATIGYRRVVIENIYKGKTGNGFSVDEFFTTFEYPFDKFYAREGVSNPDFKGNSCSKTDLVEKNSEVKLLSGLFNYVVEKQSATQGFEFIQVNMNGVPKRKATYSGNYGDPLSYLVSGQEFEYYEPGEPVNVVGFDADKNLKIYKLTPGKEMDIAREDKEIKDITLDFSVEIDISVGLTFWPPIFAGVMPSFSYTENLLSTNTTTKIISYPTLLKSTTTTVEGISSKSENIAFDIQTGDVVLVKNSDSYSDVDKTATNPDESNLYSFSIPASWIYPSMGQAATNDNPSSTDVPMNGSGSNQLNAKAASFLVHNNSNQLDDVAKLSDWLNMPERLLSAVITKFSNTWGTPISNDSKLLNEYQVPSVEKDNILNEFDKHYLPQASYTYNTLLDRDPANTKAFNRGVFSILGFGGSHPIWGYETNPANWIKSSEITKYSLNGESIEERDVLGVPSAATYGNQYRNSVPSMVAKNADFGSIYFADFESVTNLTSPAAASAHSGKRSKAISELSSGIIPDLLITPVIKAQGGLLKFWLNSSIPGLKMTVANSAIASSGSSGATLPLQPQDIELDIVATVDGWTLYQGVIDPITNLGTVVIQNNVPLVAATITLSNNNTPLAAELIDDVRFQPLNASAACFVYDPENLRLLAKFDDQHFGTYYQYNQEGKLTRQIVETERGKQPVQEMHYNIPTVNR